MTIMLGFAAKAACGFASDNVLNAATTAIEDHVASIAKRVEASASIFMIVIPSGVIYTRSRTVLLASRNRFALPLNVPSSRPDENTIISDDCDEFNST